MHELPYSHSEIREITVVIAVYNGAEYLAHAIDSVYSQDFSGGIECIVVDDGSNDHTVEIATRFNKVKIIRQENRGQSVARNAGLSSAKGDAVVFLDHDDVLLPHCLSVNAEFLSLNPDVEASAGQSVAFRQSEQTHGILEELSGTPFSKQANLRTYEDFLRGNAFVPPSVCLFRSSALREVAGFREYQSAEDLDLYLRIAKRHPILVHDNCVVLYRRHANNHSSNVGRMLAATLSVLSHHNANLQGNDQVYAALEEGRRHWIKLFGPRLPKEVVWSIKEGEFRKAWKSFSLWLRLGMPKSSRNH